MRGIRLEDGKRAHSIEGKKNMKLVSLHLTENQIKQLGLLVKNKLYPNRAEAIRFAVNDLIRYHIEHGGVDSS